MTTYSLLGILGAVLAGGCTVDAAPDLGTLDQELGREVVAVCGGGDLRCGTQAVARDGEVQAFDAPKGLGADDLAEAYAIPATGPGTPTIAIVVAFGYSKLEADLGVYRAHYNLPACTVGNGCLRIVNASGGTQLPPDAPPSNDWTIETMLDVAMASAACPRCKLLVVQGEDSSKSLLEAQDTAVSLGADVISNSWSTVEKPGVSLAQYEAFFDHPGVAIFAAAGDLGYNQGDTGPAYPATSAHVFSVGGTQLERDSSTRGFRETVWAKGGSSCSLSIAKPAYQSMSPCAYRASADLAAVADPRTGVAIYHSRNGGGWRVVGGTSAATPLVAGIFASTGHARRTTNQLAALGGALVDVTEGSNGTCGSKLCKAEAGWDGPTGFGTPNATALAALMVADEPAGSDDDDKADGESSLESAAAGGCSTSGGPGGFGALLVALVASRRRRQAANALTTPQ